MDYTGANTFAQGFAGGFGLINQAYERRDNKAYRDEMLGMQKEQHQRQGEMHDRQIKKLDMGEKLAKARAVANIFKHGTKAEKNKLSEFINGGVNEAWKEQLGPNKRFTSLEFSEVTDAEKNKHPMAVFGIETTREDGSKYQSALSENRSSDPNDKFVSMTGDQLFDFFINNSKSGEFFHYLDSAILASGGSLGEKWSKFQPIGGGADGFVQYEQTTGKGNVAKGIKNVTGMSGIPQKASDWSSARNTVKSFLTTTHGEMINGKFVLLDNQRDTFDRKTEATMGILTSLSQQGEWVDPLIVASIVDRNGQPLSKAEAWKQAETMLENAGELPALNQWGEDSNTHRKEKLRDQLIEESKQWMPTVMEELNKYRTGGGISKAQPETTVPGSGGKPKPGNKTKHGKTAEEMDTYFKASQGNKAKKDKFIEVFGQPEWDKRAKKNTESKPKPKPQPEQTRRDSEEPEVQSTPGYNPPRGVLADKAVAGLKSAGSKAVAYAEKAGGEAITSVKQARSDLEADKEWRGKFMEVVGRKPRSREELQRFKKQIDNLASN